MKAIHYTYWLAYKRNRYLADLRSLLHAFTSINNEAFRKSFRTGDGDNLLLYPISGDVFLFVVTKDREFIKAISATTLNQDAIIARLGSGEHVGFASYVGVTSRSYTVASTFHGPKQGRWEIFINDLLEKLGMGNVVFHSVPVTTVINTKNALGFAFKSSVRLQLKRAHHLTQQVAEAFGQDPELNEIEVVIKPVRGSQLRESWKHLGEYVKDQSVKKVVIRGKQDMQDALTDFYLVGNGHAFDTVDTSDEQTVVSTLKHVMTSNPVLKDAVDEIDDDHTFSKVPIPGLDRLHDTGNWPSNLVAGQSKPPN